MTIGAADANAFRFLDVRTPKAERLTEHSFVVSRASLGFTETGFEQRLKALARGPNYAAQLIAEATALASAPINAQLINGGYTDDLAIYEKVLRDRQLSPEAMIAEFQTLYARLSSGKTTANYLQQPCATAWDHLLAAAIFISMDTAVDKRTLVKLSSALRVGAALFAVEALKAVNPTDTPPRLSHFTIASFRIDKELIDTKALRDSRPTPAAPVIDSSARDLQDKLVSDLLERELAASELRKALLDQVAKPQAGIATPAPGPDAGMEVTTPFRVTIPETALSAATRAHLIQKHGAVQGVNEIKDIDVQRTMDALGNSIERVGRDLFATASPSTIGRITDQLMLLRVDLAAGIDVRPKIQRLPLAVTRSTLAPPPSPTSGVNPHVRVLGVGDLKVVKQSLLQYEAGEVAHIENVLQGQLKERLHSVKQKTEDTITVEQETITSIEKDLQSTDRFELAEESSSVISQQQKNETGVTVTASYGAVSISANTKFSDSSSQEQSNKISRSFAREVIERSVEKVQQRVRQERTRKTTFEVEETNKYAQTATTKNVVGIYRWVEKVYWAQVHTYGMRMMLEFMLPEPAAVYQYGLTKRPREPGAVQPPPPLTITPSQIDRSNYASLAARYGASIENPPPSLGAAHFAVRQTGADANTLTMVELAEGWIGLSAGPTAVWKGNAGALGEILITIGNAFWTSAKRPWYWQDLAHNATGKIPVTVITAGNVIGWNVAATVYAIPGPRLFEAWQLATYRSLLDAYQLRLSEYQEYLASQARTAPTVELRSDKEYRDIERRELQRASMETLTLQHFNAQGAIQAHPTSGWPEIDFPAATKQGSLAMFLHQSFEWEQMTYVFYPYFWARQSEWIDKIGLSNADPLFARFLSAGFARVIVPVRPAHESDVAYFLETGVPWNGSDPPVIGDENFISIIDEIKESLDAPDSGVPDGDPWQFKVPTSLVILDQTGELPAWQIAIPPPKLFTPSQKTCGGVPYNAAQWTGPKTVADAIRNLGYAIDTTGDQEAALRRARPAIRAMQMRFNELGASAVIGKALKVDGIVGPCTLRALTYFDALKTMGKWKGVS